MSWKVLLGILVVFAVMMASSYTMLIPFLPIYLDRELHAPQESLNLWSGAIFAVSFAISAVVSPLWGKLADRSGRKLMMIRSSVLLALTYLLGGLVTTPGQLFAVRTLQGFAAGLWPACLALLSACVPTNRIGIAMGLMQSANICGGILGPLFGGLLASGFGMRNSFFVAACCLSLITVVTVFVIHEPPRPAKAAVNAPAPAGRALLRDRSVLALLGAAGIANMVILSLQPIMPLYIQNLSGSDAENLILISGLVFSLGGIAAAIAAPLWGRTGQRVGFFTTMVVAFIAAGCVIGLQGLPRELLPFAGMQFLGGLCFSGIFPSANALLVLLTPSAARGTAFGLFFAAQQVGGAIGPLLGGVLASVFPLASVFFCSGGVMLALGLSLLLAAPAHLRGCTATDTPDQRRRADIERLKSETLAQLRADRAPGDAAVTGDHADRAPPR